MPTEPAPSARVDELRRQLVRNVDEIELEREHRPPLYDTRCGRVCADTAAKKLGAGVDVLAPGMRGCPYHFHHAQEEMFVILEGERSLRISTQERPEICEYPDSGKYSVFNRPFRAVQRPEASLDYWDGEP